MNKPQEIRSLVADIRIPNEGEDVGNTLIGYAVVWGEVTQEIPDFTERFQQGAFTEWLTTNPDVVALFNHDEDHLLGRTLSGTLRIQEDETGLKVKIDLPATPLGEEIKELVRRGDLRGMSIRFVATSETFEDTPDGLLRTVHTAELYDVSVVTTPAYRGTSVSLRSAESILADASKFRSQKARQKLRSLLRILEAEHQSIT